MATTACRAAAGPQQRRTRTKTRPARALAARQKASLAAPDAAPRGRHPRSYLTTRCASAVCAGLTISERADGPTCGTRPSVSESGCTASCLLLGPSVGCRPHVTGRRKMSCRFSPLFLLNNFFCLKTIFWGPVYFVVFRSSTWYHGYRSSRADQDASSPLHIRHLHTMWERSNRGFWPKTRRPGLAAPYLAGL